MTRPELFVVVALSVGWLAIAAWTFRIARRVDRLSTRASRPEAPTDPRG